MPNENSDDVIKTRRRPSGFMRSLLSKTRSDRLKKYTADDITKSTKKDEESKGSNKQKAPKKKKTPSFMSKKSLSQLMEKRDWEKIRLLFQAEEGEDQEKHIKKLEDLIDDCIDFMGENALHSLCRFCPPLDIVKMVVRVDPGLVKERDCLERSPAHMAAGWGACPEVMEYILKLHPTAAYSRDVQGKFPLHTACELHDLTYKSRLHKGKKNYQGEEGKIDDKVVAESDIGSLQHLLRFGPGVINVEDDYGLTPLQYAIQGHAGENFLKLLTDASNEELKQWHGRKNNGHIAALDCKISFSEMSLADKLQRISANPNMEMVFPSDLPMTVENKDDGASCSSDVSGLTNT